MSGMRLRRASPSRSRAVHGLEGGGFTAALPALLPAAAVLAALALRWPVVMRDPLGWDAVDFALALERYDLTAMQPHFPGYPVFVWLGSFAHRLVDDPILALGRLSAVAGALAVGLFARLAGEVDGWFTAAMAAVWLALSPLAWLTSEQAMSDATGLLGTGLFLLAAWRYHRAGSAGRAALSAFLLGLTLGVRLSYFPLALTLLALVLMRGGRGAWRDLLAAAAGGLAGVLPWLLWQVSHEGPERLLRLALQFTEGHLTDWGGAVGAAHAPAAREALFFWRNWLGLGLGGPAAHPLLGWLVLGLAAAGLWWGWTVVDGRFFLAWLLPYLAWAWLGQNPANPRHLLPLLPWTILVAAAGWARRRPAQRWASLGVLAFSLALIAGPLAVRQQEPPPVVQLARHLTGEREAPVFTWEEERVIRYYAPGVTVFRLRRLSDFRQALLAYPRRERILATSAFLEGLGPEGAAIRQLFRPVARFAGDPLIHTTYGEIVLYEAGPELYDVLVRHHK